MKRKLLAFAILTALSAGAMAGGTSHRDRTTSGPQAAVPDSATPANPQAATSSPAPVTKYPAQSGPGANDKLRPGMPDDATHHSGWDVGTSSG